MSDGMAYADLIILALIAGFILLRLRGVLGQKIGHDQPPLARESQEMQNNEPVVQVSERSAARPAEAEPNPDEALLGAITESTIKEGVQAIKAADANFTLKGFLEGARAAFEMVVEAFNKGDKQTLQLLLSPALYQVFSAEYDRRQKDEAKPEVTLIALESQEITGAKLEKNKAIISVRFISEQVHVTRNAKREIVEGDPSHSLRVEDEWVFERDVTSRNPNWKIIDT